MSLSDAEGTAEDPVELGRTPDGSVEAPQRYIDYSGQVIVRTRYSTHQRWKKPGWDPGRRGTHPYILNSAYGADESEVLAPKHDHLDVDEIEVYYVEESATVRHRVID